jgi:hypothetical protein
MRYDVHLVGRAGQLERIELDLAAKLKRGDVFRYALHNYSVKSVQPGEHGFDATLFAVPRWN